MRCFVVLWYLVSGIWYIAQAQSLIRLSMGVVLRARVGGVSNGKRRRRERNGFETTRSIVDRSIEHRLDDARPHTAARRATQTQGRTLLGGHT